MKKLAYYSELVIIITIVWLILSERFDFINIILGITIGLVALIFTNHYLILGDYKYSYYLSFFTLIRYFAFLFIQIYLSGLSSIRLIITGKTNVGIIEYHSSLSNDLAICLLANSITLTPGTVALEKKGSKLKILCLKCPEDRKNGYEEIVNKNLESILKTYCQKERII